MNNMNDKLNFNIYFFASLFIILVVILQSFVLKESYLGTLAIIASLLFINRPQFFIPVLFITAALGDRCILAMDYSATRIFSIIFIIVMLFRIIYLKTYSFSRGYFLYFFLIIAYVLFSHAFISQIGISEYSATLLLNISIAFLIPKIKFDGIKIYVLSMIGGAIYISILLYALNSGLGMVIIDPNGTFSLHDGINNNVVAQGLSQIGALFCAGIIICSSFNFKIGFLLAYCFAITSLFVVFLLGSRSAFIAIFIPFIVCAIKAFSTKNTRTIFLVMSSIFLMVLGYIINVYWLLVQRFTIEDVIESGGTHRTEIWDVVWRHIICENPILGVGFGPENVVTNLRHFGIMYSGTHNLYLDIWAQMGLIGELLFAVGLLRILFDLYKRKREQYWIWFPFLMIIASCANGIGENMFLTKAFWLNVGMGMLLCRKCDKNGKI